MDNRPQKDATAEQIERWIECRQVRADSCKRAIANGRERTRAIKEEMAVESERLEDAVAEINDATARLAKLRKAEAARLAEIKTAAAEKAEAETKDEVPTEKKPKKKKAAKKAAKSRVAKKRI